MEDNNDNRFITCNIVMYLLTQLVGECYENLTKSFGIQDKTQRAIIKMKNEFFYSRIMLTESKKNYSGLIHAQEGRILKEPKHDIKGLAIKKVNTNRNVRNAYTKLIHDDILTKPEISITETFNDFNKLKMDIEKSFMNGEITYSIPGKVNEFSSYANPLQQLTVRGTILWNSLYPDDSIVIPDKINYLKLRIPHEKDEYEYDVACDIIDRDNDINDDEKERIKEVLKTVVYDDESYAHYGLKVICLPKKIKEVPKWLSDMISLEEMLELNLKPGYKILKSLNSKVLSYQVGDMKGETMSNIIKI